MALRKDRPILFEIIQKDTPARPPRRRFGGLPGLRRARNAPPAPSVLAAEAPEPPPERPRKRVSERLLELGGKKYSLTVNWAMIAGLTAVTLLVVILAFKAGARMAGAVPAEERLGDDPIAAALDSPPRPEVLDLPDSLRRPNGGRLTANRPDRAEPRPSASEPRPAGEAATRHNPPAVSEPTISALPERPQMVREKGKHYVIAQHFPKDKMVDAEAAAEFLLNKGIACGIVTAGGDLQLIAADGFLIDQKDKAASRQEEKKCDDLKRRIREFGKEYSKTGRYAFADCYSRKY